MNKYICALTLLFTLSMHAMDQFHYNHDAAINEPEEAALEEHADAAAAANLAFNIPLPVMVLDGLHEYMINERPFVCLVPGCGARFARHYTLKIHMRTHTGERPFVCPVPECGARFARHDTLNIHMSTHTGERPFICFVPGCGKRFARHDTLKLHMHTHTGERPFVCPVPECGASFTQNRFLKRHIRGVHLAHIAHDEHE